MNSRLTHQYSPRLSSESRVKLVVALTAALGVWFGICGNGLDELQAQQSGTNLSGSSRSAKSSKGQLYTRVSEDPPKNPGSWGIGGMGKLTSGSKKSTTAIKLRPVRKTGESSRLLGAQKEKDVSSEKSEMVFEVVEKTAPVKTGEIFTGELVKEKIAVPAVVATDSVKPKPAGKEAKKSKPAKPAKVATATTAPLVKKGDAKAPGFGSLGGGGTLPMTAASDKGTSLKKPAGAKPADRLLKGKVETPAPVIAASAPKGKPTVKAAKGQAGVTMAQKAPKVAASEVDTKVDSVVPAGVSKVAPATLMSDAKTTDSDAEAQVSGGGAEGGSDGVEPGMVDPANGEAASVRVVEGNDDAMLPTWENGYFPTQDDTRYLGGSDYRRSARNLRGAGGPDNRTQLGVGLFPYDVPGQVSPQDSPYRSINNVLGSFGNFNTYTYEGDRLQGFSMTGEFNVPLFTRSFEPDKAHIKMGPAYLDFLYTGAGMLYSDYNGDRTFREGEEDGWLGFVELAIRGYVKITDQFYVSMATRLIYLPGENRLGFALGEGDSLGAFFRANYEFEWKTWDFMLYNEFRGHTFPIFADLTQGARERSGRYVFGIPDRRRRNRDFFAGDNVYFTNTTGAKASTPFIREDWRLWLQAEHREFWRSYDFDDNRQREHFGALVGYEGDVLPFAPYVSYDANSYDRFDSIYNTAYIGGRGRLTENLSLDARAGYLWTTDRDPDRDSPLWRLGLIHNLSEDTSQALWGGQTFASSDITNETALAQYIRYQIDHRFDTRLSGGAFAQLSQDENLVEGTPVTNRERVGGQLNYRMFDFSRVRGSAYYSRSSPERVPSVVSKRWIYRAEFEQQIYSRTTARFYYQFEDSEGGQNFDEHVFSLSLRRYF